MTANGQCKEMMDFPGGDKKVVDHTIWKVMSISLFTFLLGVFGAGAFSHFEQSALDLRVQQLELANGISLQRLAESEKRQIDLERHIDYDDKELMEMREKMARQTRDFNQR